MSELSHGFLKSLLRQNTIHCRRMRVKLRETRSSRFHQRQNRAAHLGSISARHSRPAHHSLPLKTTLILILIPQRPGQISKRTTK